MRAIYGALQRESLIWMLPLLSTKHLHSCWQNTSGRSQEEQQRVARTPQRENKVHMLCAVQRSISCPLPALRGAASTPGGSGRRWFSISWPCCRDPAPGNHQEPSGDLQLPMVPLLPTVVTGDVPVPWACASCAASRACRACPATRSQICLQQHPE